jgi:hypothetical protein
MDLKISGLVHREATNSEIVAVARENRTGRQPMEKNQLRAKQDAKFTRDAETISNWRSFWQIREEADRFSHFILMKIFRNEMVKLTGNVSIDACKKELEKC